MKKIPHDIEAEKAVLGSILIDPVKYDIARQYCSEDDFYNHSHKTIFSLMDHTTDAIVIINKLRETNNLESVGGPAYISKMMDIIPGESVVERYAKIVRQESKKRRFIARATEMVDACCSGSPFEFITAELEEEAFLLSQENESDKPSRIGDIVEKEIARIERVQNGEEDPGLMTGFEEMDFMLSGLKKKDLIIIAGRPGMGKELTVCSNVLMADGTFKKMGDMSIGDKVASVDGANSFVTGVFPQGIKKVYKIKFSDGREIKAGLDHQWEVMYRDWEKPRVVTTSWLIEKLKHKRYQKRLYIPTHTGSFGEDKDLTVHPYLLGVLLGDGCLCRQSVKLTTSHKHITKRITKMLMNAKLVNETPISFRLSTRRGQKNNLLMSMKKLGLMGCKSKDKFIPAQYLSASIESRLELMRGLIDTDGTLEKTGSMTFTTTSKRMAENFQTLARSLGAYASMSKRIPNYTHKGEKRKGSLAYTIYISCHNYGDFVTLPCKKERVVKKRSNRRITFYNIDYIGDFECQCISVSHDRSLYLAEDYIVTHNSSLSYGILNNICSRGIPGGFFSLEMSNEMNGQRALAAATDINSQAFLNKNFLKDTHWPKIVHAQSKLKDLPLYIDDTGGLHIAKIRSKARRMVREHGIKIIAVDYLQMVVGDKEKREQEVGQVSRELKAMAKELDLPVIAVAQLNRAAEYKKDKRPTIAELRDSGTIEQDADVIMLVYRDDYYNPTSKDKGLAEINIGKQRNGPTGMVKLRWEGKTTTFKDDISMHQKVW